MPAYDARHLIEHPQITSESIDYPTVRDLDVRQDAALRMVRTFKRNGVELPDEKGPVVEMLNEKPEYISQSLKSSLIDTQRKRKQTVSLERNYVTAERVADPHAEDALEAVESSAKDELEAFAATATPAELEALALLKHCQTLIAQNKQLPNSVRSKLKRLRKETGLALDVSLL